MFSKRSIIEIAPDGSPTRYDQQHLALYAALLDAEAAGASWRDVVADLMHLDPQDDDSMRCWRSHLERARWIVGSGLKSAISAFNTSSIQE